LVSAHSISWLKAALPRQRAALSARGAGKLGWLARYLKEVDANETTLRFWQEIHDDKGRLVEAEIPSG
jgi:hypothetical protein